MYSSNVYRSSPVWLQELLISARAYGRSRLREGRTFQRFCTEAERSQWLDADELRRLQGQNLERVLRSAAHVPFYRDLYRGLALKGPGHEVLARLPKVGKLAIREAGRSLLSEVARPPLFEGSTSGSTGAALKLLQDLSAINRENAFIWRQLRWAGWVPGSRRAWIRGDLAVPTRQSEPPYWRRSASERMLLLSSYHLSAASADAYLAALSDYGPSIIQAYPSSIGFLAQYLKATGRQYDGELTAIITSSETLSADMKQLITDRFGCPVFDWYGQFERVAAIGTCEHGTLHLIEDYSFVELEPTEQANVYELVGTGFNNHVMPLVRYRTGDCVELDDAPTGSCPCGRHFRIVRRIAGREDDPVKLPDGRVIGRMDHIFKGLHGLLDAQIRQESLQSIDILVVPSPTWDDETKAQIEQGARERLGDSIAISISTVDSIERSGNGKYRRVVSNV